MIGTNLQVFFNTGHFAREAKRVREGQPDLMFNGILGEADGEALQGYVVAAIRQFRYPAASADLIEGDLLEINGDLLETGSAMYRVMRQPERVVDGLEAVVRLSKVVP